MKPTDEMIVGNSALIPPPGFPTITATPRIFDYFGGGQAKTTMYGGWEALSGNPNTELLGPLLFSTNKMRVEAHAHQQQWSIAAYSIYQCMEKIASKMNELAAEMAEMRRAKTFVVPLTTLAYEQLQMVLDIPATIEGDGEDFTATFSEANVSASGETEADAIANLKDQLVSTYEFLESIPQDELGPLPARQWQILKNVLTR